MISRRNPYRLRQDEAVRDKRVLSSECSTPAVCQRSSNQVGRKMAPVSVMGDVRHGQFAGVGRIDHRDCGWARPWARGLLRSIDRPADPPCAVAGHGGNASART